MTVGAELAGLMGRRSGGGFGHMAGAGSPDMGTRWRVFVSHTSELRNFPAGGKSYIAEAERAISAAGHVAVDMADFPAADQPAAELCEQRVGGCDVYVGVLGTRYGSPVADRPEVSYTELEFDAATAAGLPRLVFLLDTDAADVGIPLAQLIDHAFGARQEAFRRRVQASGLVTQSFASPDQLGRLVERSLRELTAARQDAGPLPPDSVLRVWNVPPRNPGFTGRDGLLAAVRDRLLAGDRGGGAGAAGHGRGGQDPARDRVRAPVRRQLRRGVVGRCRAGRADRRPVRRPRAPRWAASSPGQAPGQSARRCWPTCTSAAGGCWSSTTPRTPPPLRPGCPAGPGTC